jgi:hypothetical protein
MTDTCAIVNESIAPNAYMLPRKSVFPGSRTTIESTPAKTTSDNQGVLNFGCRRRKTSGSCLYVAIAYVMRDAPITPALVAINRIVDARMPT